jgi:hypothetical protein
MFAIIGALLFSCPSIFKAMQRKLTTTTSSILRELWNKVRHVNTSTFCDPYFIFVKFVNPRSKSKLDLLLLGRSWPLVTGPQFPFDGVNLESGLRFQTATTLKATSKLDIRKNGSQNQPYLLETVHTYEWFSKIIHEKLFR